MITNEIRYENLMMLLRSEIAAIQIKNYCAIEIRNHVIDKLLGHKERGHFNKANDIERIGMAHYEIDCPDKFNRYHETAIQSIWRTRDIFKPYISPIDKLRLELEEIWPAGAYLETLYGRKCFVGICRIMEPNIELLAHNDRLNRDSPDSYQAHSLLGQLSACVYLQVPTSGGELKLWNDQPKDEDEYTRLKDGKYGIDPIKLGQPALEIKPEDGDLLIFNIHKYHAVAPSGGKCRINIGTFIGYRGDCQPLTYWS